METHDSAVLEWVKRVGDSVAGEASAAGLYAELREIARGLLKGGKPGVTLQPTALVHEAYLRIARLDSNGGRGRMQFLALAAKAMRSVLVDHARRKGALRRGGGASKDTLSRVANADGAQPEDLIDLDAALEEFERIDPERAQVVDLLFFGGLSTAEVAEVLDMNQRAVQRAFATARAWLYQRLAAGFPHSA